MILGGKDASRDDIIRKFVVLLKLEEEARKTETFDELRFHIVNETKRGISYNQAFLWERDFQGKLQLTAVTGISHPDAASPYFQHFQTLIHHLIGIDAGRGHTPLSQKDFPASLAPLMEDLKEINHQFVFWCPFLNNKGEVTGGLWLNRGIPWTSQEGARLEFLTGAYGHALRSLAKSGSEVKEQVFATLTKIKQKKFQLGLVVFLFLLLFIPVRQSAIAPAEVVSIHSSVMAPPIDGVIKEIHVKPNEVVQKGQLLFELEDQVIRNTYDVALKSLEVARADYLMALNKAFSEPESKARVPLLKAMVEQKESEVAYSRDLLERIKVKASEDGVAVFSDPNDWLGKPVSVGEKIISLENPDMTELKIWLPVNDAISLDKGANVKAFLNIDPTNPLDALLEQTSYEARLSPEDNLSFILKASFVEGMKPPRIGLKAMAKVYGERVTLFYYLFRKPIASVRQFLGV